MFQQNWKNNNGMHLRKAGRREQCAATKLILWLVLTVVLACVSTRPAAAAEDGLTEKAKDAAQKTSQAVQDAGNSAANKIKDLWSRIDAARLQKRTRDELVAWVIMGVLVGALAGTMTSLKATGLGRFGQLLWGLAGAFLGGIFIHVSKLDFGWGPVLIRYEELLFSFVGAILLLVIGRFLRARTSKAPSR
jgi:uncharacterized membrane protein YeaQ/YmgE (transglycosylase-associated protein family)